MYAHTIAEATNVFSAFPTLKTNYNQSISSIIQVISLTTDKESLARMAHLYEVTSKLKNTFDSVCERINIDNLKEMTKSTNDLIVSINGLMDNINGQVGQADQEGFPQIKIDDENMIAFLKYLNGSKENLIYISEYLNVLVDVQKAKTDLQEGKSTKYTLETFLETVNAA